VARELWEALQTPLDDEATMPPVRRDADLDKQKLKRLQNAVAEVAREHDIPEGVIASRRWLEALMESGAWPDALKGWRQALLAPRFAAILG
jgi:ribonuclease D